MSNRKKIHVLLADDHPLIRAGIKSSLEHETDICVVAEASNGDKVLELCDKHNIDVLVLDLRMPGLPTKEVINKIHENFSEISILILSAFEEDIYIRTLSSMGISGYVLKDEAIEKLVEAVRSVYKGETWFSQRIIQKMLSLNNEDKSSSPTEREITILKLIKNGTTYEEIGKSLCITERTVRFHASNIQDKLGAKNRVDAITKAIEKGWIE